jgi:hypothetical protein
MRCQGDERDITSHQGGGRKAGFHRFFVDRRIGRPTGPIRRSRKEPHGSCPPQEDLPPILLHPYAPCRRRKASWGGRRCSHDGMEWKSVHCAESNRISLVPANSAVQSTATWEQQNETGTSNSFFSGEISVPA